MKVAIVYHCVAHYREPIFNFLCKNTQDGVEYTIISGEFDHTPSLKTVPIGKKEIAVDEGGLRWRIVKNYWFFKKLLWQTGVVKLAISDEFDAIIYLGVVYHLSTWVSCALANLKGKKTLMWSHGYLRNEHGLKGWVRSRFYKLCNVMLLYHNRSKNIFLKKGFAGDKLQIVYNSLDVDRQKKVRETITDEKLKETKNKIFKDVSLPVVLWIGRLTKHKKLEMIIEAAKRLDEKNIKVNFLFIGRGPMQLELKALADHLKISKRIFFYGACHDEKELGPLVALSDICVAPGEVGLTCMHSLVYGTPVITHNDPDFQMPEYEAITPGKTGQFFIKNDIDDLVKTINNWLSKSEDRQEIRKNCYKIIDTYYNPEYQYKIITNAVKGL